MISTKKPLAGVEKPTAAPTTRISQCRSDRIFDCANLLLMLVLGVIFLWPLIFVVSASFSDPSAVWNGKVLLWPVHPTLDGYVEVFKNKNILIGYRNTIFYTVLGTCINLVMTVCAAYPLSRQDFMLRKPLTFFFMFTMYFGGGLIPTYLIVKGLGLIDTPWVLVIVSAVSIYNVIITRTYFENSIPTTLREAAELDGASTMQFLLRIALPLSTPILAVMALYYGVGHWNSYFNALLYINKTELLPLQSFLREILMMGKMNIDLTGLDPAEAEAKNQLSQTIKYSVIIVSTVPVLCIYPFIQKHFVKGVMIGAIKG